MSLINEKQITIKINSANRKKYEEKIGKSFVNGESITISQLDLLEKTRIEVDCTCDFCGEIFSKKRNAISGTKTFCNNSCRNSYLSKLYKTNGNPNPSKKKIEVNCFICKKSIEIHESKYKKQDSFLCSRECYKEHRSKNYSKTNTYNYQEIFVDCSMCETKVKTSKWYLENKKHIFCSAECYWNHRKKYYKEFYYRDDLNNYRKETNPERLVREWLEEKGFEKDKDFYQECGFLKKYYVDFYIPKYKLMIEVYGDYWHVNPNIYDIHGNDETKKPVNNNQRELLESNYDELRIEELQSYGYTVHILWEEDILNNLDKHMKNIFNKKSI